MTEQAIHRETAETGNLPGRSAVSDWAQEVAALAKRWFIELGQEKLNLVFSVAQPAIWLVFFGVGIGRAVDKQVIGTSDYTGFTLPGIVAFTVVSGGVAAAMPLMWDKESGYLDKLMSMPISRSSIIVSRFVYQFVLATAQVLALVAVAIIGGVHFEAGPGAVVVIIVTAGLLSLAVTASFSALAYWVPGHGTFFAITGFITMPLLFISNAFVPVEALPRWMEITARLNPLTYAIEAMRIPVIEGWDADILVSLAVLLAAGLVCLALGAQQFNKQTGDRVN
ncbi:MAG: ABC transporter permease [Dehalococcoidia bacterium]